MEQIEDNFQNGLDDYLNSTKPLSTLQLRYLLFLQKINFNPLVCYDIGASHFAWSNAIKTIFPEVTIISFDASHQYGSLYENNLHFYNCLSDLDNKEIKFYEFKPDDRFKSYYKPRYCGDNYTILNTTKLDTLVNNNRLPDPTFIKINTCGSEYDIIKGGEETIKKAEYLIVTLQNEEIFANAPIANTVGPYIESLGFKLINVLDPTGTPIIDYVFRNKKYLI
jgi:FkbM family methyltransferase